MIKLGTTKKKGSKKCYSYMDVKTDYDGWVDSTQYLPVDYDLVYVRVNNGINVRTKVGWYTGYEFDGLHLKDNEKIEYWKRKGDETNCTVIKRGHKY